MKFLRFLLPALAICLVPGLAQATSGVPSMEFSTAEMPGGGGGILTLMIVPDGSGPGFAEARDLNGNVVDATIEFYLADPADYPIYNFPREDIWLEVDDGSHGPAVCRSWADGPSLGCCISLDDNTDRQGLSSWSRPLAAGGYADAPVRVMVNATPLLSNTGLPLRFNSPDITGDGKVDLADVVPFAQDYYGGYHFRSDLAHDGVINLSDVAKIAEHMGAGCP